MPGLADGSRTDSRRATYVVASTEGNASGGAAGVPSTCLMAAGSGLTIPRLDGVAVAHQLREGEQATARLARTFVQAGVAEIDDWIAAKRKPFEFLKRSLDRWLKDHRVSSIQEQFFLDLTISTSLDRYFSSNDCSTADASEVFLTLEPESAGYVILGPTLRLLEAAHARLPATFVHLFLGALNQVGARVRLQGRAEMAETRVEAPSSRQEDSEILRYRGLSLQQVFECGKPLSPG